MRKRIEDREIDTERHLQSQYVMNRGKLSTSSDLTFVKSELQKGIQDAKLARAKKEAKVKKDSDFISAAGDLAGQPQSPEKMQSERKARVAQTDMMAKGSRISAEAPF